MEDVRRSGLKALRPLEQGFDRAELTAQISELAKGYVNPEPAEDNIEALEVSRAEPARLGAATSETETIADQAGSRPMEEPLVEPPAKPGGSGLVRDVPSGIPPLNHAGAEKDRWRTDPDNREAAKTKKWRRLFDAAAATVLALVLAASLLRGLDIWSDQPVADDLEVETAGTPQAAKGEDQDGLFQALLRAVGWGGAGHEAADPDQQPAEPSSTAVTITLESSEEAGQPGQPESRVELFLEDEAVRPSAAAGKNEPTSKQAELSAGEPVQTAALPPSPSADSYTHWVRLGAFRREESAPIQWRQLQHDQADLLAHLSHEITKVEREGQETLYLLKAGPLPDEAASKQLCRALTGRGVECLALRSDWSVAELPESTSDETPAAKLPEVAPVGKSIVSKNADLYKLR